MRKLSAVLAASVVLTAVIGCSTPVIPRDCPAIGHSTVIPIEVGGPRADDVVAVQICSDEDGCSTGVPVQAPHEPMRDPSPKPPSPMAMSATSQSEPAASLFASFRTTRSSEKNWKIETDMVQPATATFQALGSSGEVLVRTEAALEWTRISGSEECGGNARSTTVSLDTA